MAEAPTDVLVAGYPDIDGAKDFESLVALIRDMQVSIDDVILVTDATDGSVAGGVIGKFAGHRVGPDISGHSDS
jgi:hypothetical protein